MGLAGVHSKCLKSDHKRTPTLPSYHRQQLQSKGIKNGQVPALSRIIKREIHGAMALEREEVGMRGRESHDGRHARKNDPVENSIAAGESVVDKVTCPRCIHVSGSVCTWKRVTILCSSREQSVVRGVPSRKTLGMATNMDQKSHGTRPVSTSRVQ